MNYNCFKRVNKSIFKFYNSFLFKDLLKNQESYWVSQYVTNIRIKTTTIKTIKKKHLDQITKIYQN
jgi:hypothetical protein